MTMAGTATMEAPAPQGEAKQARRNVLDDVMQATDDLRVRLGKKWGVAPSALLQYVRSYIGHPEGTEVPWEIVYQFMAVADQHDLNPALKEIYGFWRPEKGLQSGVMIDGWITLANRRKEYDGYDYEYERDDNGFLTAVTCFLYRKDRTRPTKVRVKMTEWRVSSSPNWREKPEWMLEGKGLKQAIRLGLGFAGLQDDDDLDAIIRETMKQQASAPKLDKPTGISLADLTPGQAPPADEYERKPKAKKEPKQTQQGQSTDARPPESVDGTPAQETETPLEPAPAVPGEHVDTQTGEVTNLRQGEADELTTTHQVVHGYLPGKGNKRGAAKKTDVASMSDEERASARKIAQAELVPGANPKALAYARGVLNLIDRFEQQMHEQAVKDAKSSQ